MRTLNKVLIGTFLTAFCWFIHSLYGWIGVGIFFGILISLPFVLLQLGILFVIIYALIASMTFHTEN